jgi:glycine/D-amino acid oxidase-like deaminating enzyme
MMRPHSLSRRSFAKSAVSAALLGSCGRARRGPHVIVVGAGAFGGWTALHLLRRGARVTLLDAWGPGNGLASSGGETRVIRATYGPDRPYVELVARALVLWREHERHVDRRLLYPIGVLWMVGPDGAYERAALPLVREAGLRIDELTVAGASARYPQIDFQGVHWVIHEPDSGYLTARLACETVRDAFVAEGGDYRQARARVDESAGELRAVVLEDGSVLTADRYVFACGSWLATVLRGAIGRRIRPTRQEVFFFETPAGDRRFDEDRLPVWIDNGSPLFYGIPGPRQRGFKLADDTRGPETDPTSGDRTPSAAGIAAARAYLARRFPALATAPLLGARVCPYENSPDGHYIIDRLPAAPNAWVVGGGSGHGFKVGPALGEMVAGLVLDDRDPPAFFGLSRLSGIAQHRA